FYFSKFSDDVSLIRWSLVNKSWRRACSACYGSIQSLNFAFWPPWPSHQFLTLMLNLRDLRLQKPQVMFPEFEESEIFLTTLKSLTSLSTYVFRSSSRETILSQLHNLQHLELHDKHGRISSLDFLSQ